MKSASITLAFLLGLGFASPLNKRQNIDFDAYNAIPDVPDVAAPVGDAPPAQVTYVPSHVAELAAEAVTAIGTASGAQAAVTALAKRSEDGQNTKRYACQVRSPGAGPTVNDPDTVAAFTAYPAFASNALAAVTPPGYKAVVVNSTGAAQDSTYMTYKMMTSYSPSTCASFCQSIAGCNSFNLYYERDGSVEPGPTCMNPPSITYIKCSLFGGMLTAASAVNVGQWQANFHVVIAGSNIYSATAPKVPPGYTMTELNNATINAPFSYIGNQVFPQTQSFDPSVCAAALEAKSAFDVQMGLPSKATPDIGTFFTAYILYKNGRNGVFTCAYYTSSWDSTYATNVGQWDSAGNHYTIGSAYGFAANAAPVNGLWASTCNVQNPIYNSLQQDSQATAFCASYLGASSTTVTVATVTVVQDSTTSTTTTVLATVAAPVTKRAQAASPVPTPAYFSNLRANVISAECSCLGLPKVYTVSATATTTSTAVSTKVITTTNFVTATPFTCSTKEYKGAELVKDGSFEKAVLSTSKMDSTSTSADWELTGSVISNTLSGSSSSSAYDGRNVLVFNGSYSSAAQNFGSLTPGARYSFSYAYNTGTFTTNGPPSRRSVCYMELYAAGVGFGNYKFNAATVTPGWKTEEFFFNAEWYYYQDVQSISISVYCDDSVTAAAIQMDAFSIAPLYSECLHQVVQDRSFELTPLREDRADSAFTSKYWNMTASSGSSVGIFNPDWTKETFQPFDARNYLVTNTTGGGTTRFSQILQPMAPGRTYNVTYSYNNAFFRPTTLDAKCTMVTTLAGNVVNTIPITKATNLYYDLPTDVIKFVSAPTTGSDAVELAFEVTCNAGVTYSAIAFDNIQVTVMD